MVVRIKTNSEKVQRDNAAATRKAADMVRQVTAKINAQKRK